MAIILNWNDKIITGSINADVYSVTFAPEKLAKLQELVAKANAAQTVADYNAAVEEFKQATEETISGVIGTDNEYIYVDQAKGTFHLKYNNAISTVPMPKALVDRIKESVDKKIDYLPLIKAWVRWLRNPKLRKLSKAGQEAFSQRFFNYINIKYTNQELVNKLIEEKGYSEELARQLATTYQVKITNEGLLATFKVSREITKRYRFNDKGKKEEYDVYSTGTKTIDPISGLVTTEKVELSNEDRYFEPAVQGKGGDAFYCGDTLGHYIRVGQVHRLPDWSYVNCDDNQSCVKGLHKTMCLA